MGREGRCGATVHRPIWSIVSLPPPLPLLPMQLLVKGPVELWWPAGYGAQPLYNISATFRPSACSACPCTASTGRSSVGSSDVPPWEEDPTTISEPPCPSSSGGGQQATGDGCSSVQRAIGFRTLELVTDPLKKVSTRGADGGERGLCSMEKRGGFRGPGTEARSFISRVARLVS